MGATPRPSLYQVNTRVWLTELSRGLGRPAILDDIPDAALDAVAGWGFDWVWCLSVWSTGPASRRISLTDPEWRREFEHTLPDLHDDDIRGSGFAIRGYTVDARLGGDPALARLRERLRARGLALMLDFVPNHMALDHPWVESHPDYFVAGTEHDLHRAPRNYTWVSRTGGERLLAHGRDPYFPGWSDTLQLDYGNSALQEAMRAELLKVAGQCDGVRCDMAMLVLPEVFEQTWGRRAQPFWPRAIAQVREQNPDFRFMAEVYWDLEWTLLQQGFDWAYDKRLYDRLHRGEAAAVRGHLCAGLDFQERLVRFLENHDEARAAAAFPPGRHEAAAIVTYLSPGLRFVHQGQLDGFRTRISPHLIRGPREPVDLAVHRFYASLLALMRQPPAREGAWRLLECTPAWDGNWTWDAFIAWAWEARDGRRWLIAVNYGDHQSQCYVRLPFAGLAARAVRFEDQTSAVCYERDGDDLLARGLYLDVPAWAFHVFEVTARP